MPPPTGNMWGGSLGQPGTPRVRLPSLGPIEGVPIRERLRHLYAREVARETASLPGLPPVGSMLFMSVEPTPRTSTGYIYHDAMKYC